MLRTVVSALRFLTFVEDIQNDLVDIEALGGMRVHIRSTQYLYVTYKSLISESTTVRYRAALLLII